MIIGSSAVLPAGGGVKEILNQSVVVSPQTDLKKNSYSWPCVRSVNSIEEFSIRVPDSGSLSPACCKAYSKVSTSAATHEIDAEVAVKLSRLKDGVEHDWVIPSNTIFGKKFLNWPVGGEVGSGLFESL